ncbi:MAG: hypothetical protein ACFFD4_13235 [Candidatus Odinarchaeota archaeon]
MEDIFENARERWKALSSETGWFTVFGDIYYVRYPIATGESHSYGIKQSIYHSDDSVHAFDATGVRSTIIDRVIRSESRGIIRPWYADIAFFAESTNLRSLKGIKEDVLDYVVRSSLEDKDIEDATEGLYVESRKRILSLIDPTVEKRPDGKYNEFELEKVKEAVVMEIRPHIELFGLCSAFTTRVFAFSDEEIERIVDIILDPDNADDFLRKRFIEKDMKEYMPFIGQYHTHNHLKSNFVVESIGGNDAEFYKRRAMQLWLFSLLSFDPKSKEYFYSKKAEFFQDLEEWVKNSPLLPDQAYKDLIKKALAYAKLESVTIRFLHTIRTEYAQALNYTGYASRLYHLLNDRKIVMESLSDFFIPIDTGRHEVKNILLNLSLSMIEACMQKLENQIPIPIGQQEMRRIIIAKRKANLRKAVLTEEIKEQLLQEIMKVGPLIDEDTDVVQKYLRVPFETLNPRGEAYFEDMKETVYEQMAAMGGHLKQELKKATDLPSTLVKQFGKQANKHLKEELHMRPFNIDLKDIYAAILSLKARELMFDDATTSFEKRITVTNSLLEDYFNPQFEFLKAFLPYTVQFDEEIAEEEPLGDEKKEEN